MQRRTARKIGGRVDSHGTQAVVAPCGGITAFEFRVVNGRHTRLMVISAVVTMSRFEGEPPNRKRRFYQLPLEQSTVAFFPLNWSVGHPIDETSPLWRWVESRLMDAEVEFDVLLTAVDETLLQTVHSPSSYTAEELRVGHRFERMFSEDDDEFVLDMEKLSQTRPE